MIKIYTLLSLVFFAATATAQYNIYPPYLLEDNEWVDSLMQNMTLEQKIAQMFMIDVGNNEKRYRKTLSNIKKYQVGGIIFFRHKPTQTVEQINRMQAMSQIPMIVSIDGEWGLAMRIDSTMRFPVAMALGALQNDSLIYQSAYYIAKQCRAMGITMNLAPDVDVNNNPDNPVINYRSFGENPYKVATKATLFVKGLQSGGVLDCIKHFPGHGDTQTDSHKELPVIDKSYNQLQKTELIPFRQLVVNGASAVMTAHIHLPQLDSNRHISATISPKIQAILRDSLLFQGLVITDALTMKGVAKYWTEGKLELMAVRAGADILLMPADVEKGINAIKQAVKNGTLSQERINKSCRKILQAKYWLKLNKFTPIDAYNFKKELATPEAKVVQQKAFRQTLTVIKNDNNILPVKDLTSEKYATLAIGSDTVTPFQQQLDKYTLHKNYYLPNNATTEKINRVLAKLKNAPALIVSLHHLRLTARNNYDLTAAEVAILDSVAALNKKVIFALLGNPYVLTRFEAWKKFQSIIISYQDNSLTENFTAQLIYGAQGANAKLPVGINEKYPAGTGLEIHSLGRLRYGIPEDVGLNSQILNHKIDSIAQIAIDSGAFPGCQVLIAKNGEVVFHKTYGYHTYNKKMPVRLNDVYDMASVTKITTSVPAIMYMVANNKLNIYDKISGYYKPWKHSNKKDIRFIDALTHQARLTPWIPFYKKAQTFGLFHRPVFSNTPSKKYNLIVAPNIYEHKRYPKMIYKKIAKSPLLEKKEYKYSDLSFYIYPKIIEKLSGQNWEDFLQNTFYKPLGADETGYNAWKRFPLERIVPTENDTFFRMQQLHGYVHDEGAAMLNGISGHAGLFATANDLAKIMQMYVQLGQYAGKEYISHDVFEKFITRPFANNNNRRGIGFDKPYIGNSQKKLVNAFPAPSSGDRSFGHGGYTGTFVWADPDNQITFIFLSNRVYPTRNNRKLYQLNIRPAMHQAIYDAMMNSDNN